MSEKLNYLYCVDEFDHGYYIKQEVYDEWCEKHPDEEWLLSPSDGGVISSIEEAEKELEYLL